MLTKWWELTCDYCGATMNHYIGNKPSNDELIQDGFYVSGSKHYCNINCYLKDKQNK